ncbi:hypothetical protein GCM10009861_03200 [Neomicrococcus aestuarii]
MNSLFAEEMGSAKSNVNTAITLKNAKSARRAGEFDATVCTYKRAAFNGCIAR